MGGAENDHGDVSGNARGPANRSNSRTTTAATDTGSDTPVQAAGARVGRAVGLHAESLAERVARRRRAAQATLDIESRAGAMDWSRLGVFGVGIVIGAFIGVGATLLLAPATGDKPRPRIVRD